MADPIKLSNSTSTGKPVVNAKELHKSLGVKKDFTLWIKSKIKRLHLIEDQDFSLVFFDIKNKQVKREEGKSIYNVDCVLTLSTSKTIALTYKSAKGKKIAQFLIATEMHIEKPVEKILEPEEETITFDENNPITTDHPIFITSREIAEATGKLHKNVIRDINEMCKQGNIEIHSAQNRAESDTEEVIVVESEYMINLGDNKQRSAKEYLLNSMAAEVLSLGYDVMRRIAMVKLIRKMRKVIELQAAQPAKTIMIEATNISFTDTAKLLGTNNHRLLSAFRKNRYMKPNNQPYEKYFQLGYFVRERYQTSVSATKVMLTPIKGFTLAQEVMNKNIQLPEKYLSELPVPNDFNVQLPMIITNIEKTNKETQDVLHSMTNYILMVKAGNSNKIEEEKYLSVLRNFNKNYK